MKRLAVAWATFFGIGRIAIAPGTWASLLTTLIVYAVAPYMNSSWTVAAAALVVFLTGIPAAAAIEKLAGKKDPRSCVIDEVAGQLVTLFMVPRSAALYFAAFLLFRLFDIAKPFPVKQSEMLPNGIGIMLDDVLAGLYAWGVLQFVCVFLLHRPLHFG